MDQYQKDRAIELHTMGLGYKKIGQELSISPKTIESHIVRYKRSQGISEQKEIDIQTELIKDLQKQSSRSFLCDKYKITDRILSAYIEDIKDKGYQVLDDLKYGQVKICKDVVNSDNVHKEEWNGNKIIRFGVVSDTHLCSKWQQLTFLNHLYDVFQDEGITTVFHSGDLTDGYHMHPGHQYEVFKHGADEQEQYVIDYYPSRKGILTKFITGNHDHSHIKSGGHDIGNPIMKARPDMIYLGLSNAKVYITPNCIVELNHPLDGASYALSYAPQKTIDAMEGGEKPNILLNGHHHKMLNMFYRNIQCYEAGTTCAQTPWMRGKRIAAMVGGWIIEVHVDNEGTITRCKDEKILLYKPLEHDYK
jgi:hypothetical protein